MHLIIGVDFDNTLVSYDEVMHKVAVQWGLISPDVRKNKKDVRDKIRQLSYGETEWQRLQSTVYGSRMHKAKLVDGVETFFRLCQKHPVRVYVISHKTEYANFEPGTNLRSVALAWMGKNRFFEADGLGLTKESVFFEATRQEKIKRIMNLGCTHFIDDLEETFLEGSFPTNVEKILYAPHMQRSLVGAIRVVTSWQEVNEYLFETRD